MLAAIERGRHAGDRLPERRGRDARRAHGIATPVNERIVETVWAIAKGELKSSRETLDQVCSGE